MQQINYAEVLRDTRILQYHKRDRSRISEWGRWALTSKYVGDVECDGPKAPRNEMPKVQGEGNGGPHSSAESGVWKSVISSPAGSGRSPTRNWLRQILT